MRNIFIALGEAAQYRVKCFQAESEIRFHDSTSWNDYVFVLPSIDDSGLDEELDYTDTNTLYMPPFDIKNALVSLQKNPWLADLRKYLEYCKNYLEDNEEPNSEYIPKLLYRLHHLNTIRQLLMMIEKKVSLIQMDTNATIVLNIFVDLQNPSIAACLADITVQIRHLYPKPYYSIQLYIDIPDTSEISSYHGAQVFSALQTVEMLKTKQWHPENILNPLLLEVPKKWFDSCIFLDRSDVVEQLRNDVYKEKKLLHPLSALILRKSFGNSHLRGEEDVDEFSTYNVLDISLNRKSISDEVVTLTLQNVLSYTQNWSFNQQEYNQEETFKVSCDDEWYLSDPYLLGDVETPRRLGILSKKWDAISDVWNHYSDIWLEDLKKASPNERLDLAIQQYENFYATGFRLAGVQNFYGQLHDDIPVLAKLVAERVETDLLNQWKTQSPFSLMPQALQEVLSYLENKLTLYNEKLASISQEVFHSKAIVDELRDKPKQFISSSRRWYEMDEWQKLEKALLDYYSGNTQQYSYSFALNYLKALHSEIEQLISSCEACLVEFSSLNQKISRGGNSLNQAKAQLQGEFSEEYGVHMIGQIPLRAELPLEYLKSLLHPAFIHGLAQQFDRHIHEEATLDGLVGFLTGQKNRDLLDQLSDVIRKESKSEEQDDSVESGEEMYKQILPADLAVMRQAISEFYEQVMSSDIVSKDSCCVLLLSENMHFIIENNENIYKLIKLVNDNLHKISTSKQPDQLTFVAMNKVEVDDLPEISDLRMAYQKELNKLGTEKGLFMLQGVFHQCNWLSILSGGNKYKMHNDKKRQTLLLAYFLNILTLENDKYIIKLNDYLVIEAGDKWYSAYELVENDAIWFILYDKMMQFLQKEYSKENHSSLKLDVLNAKLFLQKCINEIKEAYEISDDNGDLSMQYKKAGIYLPWARAASYVAKQLNTMVIGR